MARVAKVTITIWLVTLATLSPLPYGPQFIDSLMAYLPVAAHSYRDQVVRRIFPLS